MAFGKVSIPPVIGGVEAGSPAERAGLKQGDRVLAVSGQAVESFEDLRRLIFLNAGAELDLTIDRDGRQIMLKAVPQLTEKECIGQLGVRSAAAPQDLVRKSFGPLGAFQESLSESYFWLKQPFQFIGQLVSGNACSKQLGGPIRIAQASKDVATASFWSLLPWIAIISISIGLLNLFPIPVLDGGHLLFYGAEAILGRPLSAKTQEIGFQIGLFLLLMLMIFATWNDVSELLGRGG
jgi:regulator of sigma E protease